MTKILVVEDNPLSVVDLEHKLKMSGYEVPWSVSSGEEALEIVRREGGPDVVLMDIFLAGEIDGVETARIIFDRYGIPVLFLTQVVDPQILQRAKRAHAYGYALKPVEPAEIDAAIQIALEKSAAQHDLEHDSQQLRSVFDSMVNGFCLVEIWEGEPESGKKFRIMEINPSFATLLGRSSDRLSGQFMEDIGNSLSRRCLKVFLAVSCSGGSEKFEYHSSECDKYFNVFVFTPQVGNIACITNDITEHRREEEALKLNEKRFRDLSISDELTGLFNNRHFFKQLNVELERSVRYGHKLSLIFIDIDDFKSYNDTYGHLEGDRVLKIIGGLIRESIRNSDIPFRYGGEEFVVVLPETSVFEAVQIGERIRKDFRKLVFEIPGHEGVQRTLSIGVVELREGEGGLDFLKRADVNMYKAKSSGKDRTAFDS